MRATPDVLQDLAARIRAIEAAAPPRGPTAGALPLPFLDTLLGPAGLGAGSLVELLSATDGAGAWTLGLYWARHACTRRKTLILVDARGWFYPPAAAALGVDLDHVILIRPASRPDSQAALDLSLRCGAVGAVVGWCERLTAAEAQRLKLAAEAGGGLGLILRPLGAAPVRRSPTCVCGSLRKSPPTAPAGYASTWCAGAAAKTVNRSPWRSTMKRVMCVYLPNWPLQRLGHEQPALRARGRDRRAGDARSARCPRLAPRRPCRRASGDAARRGGRSRVAARRPRLRRRRRPTRAARLGEGGRVLQPRRRPRRGTGAGGSAHRCRRLRRLLRRRG